MFLKNILAVWLALTAGIHGASLSFKETLKEPQKNKVNTGMAYASIIVLFMALMVGTTFAGVDMYTNEAIASFIPSPNLDSLYSYYSFPLFLIKNANENIYGAKLLNQELIKNAVLVMPSREEQTTIAHYLDQKTTEIATLIQKEEQRMALLKEYRASLISEVVTGKICVLE